MEKIENIKEFLFEKIKNYAINRLPSFIKKNEELLYYVVEKTKFLNSEIINEPIISQRLWHIYNNVYEIPKCPECYSNHAKFNCFSVGYRIFCSNKCARVKITTEKYKQTCLETYGVENVSQNKEIHNKKKQTKLEHFGDENYNNREKFKETMIDKYGVEHATQNKEIFAKLQQTNLETYGNVCGLLNEEIKIKTKKTLFENYGVEHPFKSEEIRKIGKATKLEKYGNKNYNNRDAAKQTCIKKYGVDSPNKVEEIKEKTKTTNLKNYGVENVFQSEEIKEKIKKTNLEKYGSENVMQNTEIMNKHSKSSKKYKEYFLPSGKKVLIQGYEKITLDLLFTKHKEDDVIVGDIEIKNEIGEIWYVKNNKKHRYYPDVYVKSINTIFETKSDWTYKSQLEENIIKKKSSISQGFNFEFIIYDSKKNIISENDFI